MNKHPVLQYWSRGKLHRMSHHVWQVHYGLKIPRGHVIHHIDENPENNSIGNLQVLTRKTHLRIHRGWKRINGLWYKVCRDCKMALYEFWFYSWKDPRSSHAVTSSRCRDCFKAFKRKYYRNHTAQHKANQARYLKKRRLA